MNHRENRCNVSYSFYGQSSVFYTYKCDLESLIIYCIIVKMEVTSTGATSCLILNTKLMFFLLHLYANHDVSSDTIGKEYHMHD